MMLVFVPGPSTIGRKVSNYVQQMSTYASCHYLADLYFGHWFIIQHILNLFWGEENIVI